MSYFPQVFALCCSWELFSACSGAAPLHCTQNQQLGQCRARLCSLGWHEVPGPLLMTSSWLSHAWPAGRAASRAAAHARLLLPLLSRHKSTPPTPTHTHPPPSQSPAAAADYSWWLHFNHILFNFLLSPRRHATLAAEYSTSGCRRAGVGEWG